MNFQSALRATYKNTLSRAIYGLAAGLLLFLIAAGVFQGWRQSEQSPSLILAAPEKKLPVEALRHNNLGVALMDAGPKDPNYFPEAIKEFQQALQIAPDYFNAKLNLGMAYYYAGQKEHSLQVLEVLLKANPDSLHVNFMLGLLHETDGNYLPARAYFQKVIQLDPMDAKAWYNLGYCYSKERQYNEAVPPLRKAAQFEPYQRQFRYNLFMALNRAGMAEDAQVELDNFKKLETSNIKAVAPPKSTLEYLRQGKYAEAIADTLPDAVQTPPPPRYTNLALELGVRFQRAASLADKDLAKILRGEPLPRGWYANKDNQEKLVSAFSAGSSFCDYNADGRLDLFLVNSDGKHALYEQTPAGKFKDVSAESGLAGGVKLGTTAVWGDLDNDSWPDLLLAGYGEVQLWRNNKGKFEEITESAGIAKAVPAGFWTLGPAMADVDHDGDLDLFLPGAPNLLNLPEKAELRFPGDFQGCANLLLRNNLDGTFVEISQEARVAGSGQPFRSVYFSDVNSDRSVDYVLMDFAGKPQVHLNQSDGTFAAAEIQPAKFPKLPPLGESRSYGDFDRDGALDELVAGSGQLTRLNRNENRPANWLIVQLQGYAEPGKVKSNKLGIGTKAEIRSVGRWEIQELRAGNGMGGCDAAEVSFDLAGEKRVDFVRSVFPSGVRWTLKDVAANQGVKISEPLLDVNSCPTLFAWDGSRFGFISDTISAGILGEMVSPGVFSQPDPDEWVRVTADQLQPTPRGTFDFRWANPLEEVTYLDSVQLLAVDHPENMEVYANERMVNNLKNRESNRLFALRNLKTISRATDHHGHDVTANLRQVDRQYFDDFELLPFKGFAKEWSLTLDLGDLSSNRSPVLLLYSWSYWNSSASVLAASQARQTLRGPILEVRGQDGRWRVGTDDMGVSAGLPRMIVLDLAPLLRPGERLVRIRSNRTLYYDQALIAERLAQADVVPGIKTSHLHTTELPLLSGRLQWLGYPQRNLPDNKLPEVYDYSSIEQHSNYGLHAGMLTRYGDVKPLVEKVDDRFVIMEHGEEVALSFDAQLLPPPPKGWKRTYFLYSDGYEKGHEIHSATATTVDPMPFHEMEVYPYPGRSARVSDPGHWEYLVDWNTRPSFMRR